MDRKSLSKTSLTLLACQSNQKKNQHSVELGLTIVVPLQ